jgi:gliding motility-associated-like protein
VTYTATDGAGNTSTCTFNVIVVDDTDPVFSGCSNVYALANNSCEAAVTWRLPLTTDCSAVNLVGTHSSGDVFAIGTTTVMYTATDARGNISTCSFDVIVEDKTTPVFQNCPVEVKVDAEQGCEAKATWTEPSVIDNCGTVTVTSSHASGTVFPAGTTTVTYKAVDQHGNESVCEFNVIVRVVALPSINGCPEEIVLKSNEHGEATAEWTPPSASTTCGNVSVTSSHDPGDTFGIGTTTVEYTAEDEFGNISICSFNIIVMPQAIDIDISKIVTPDGNAQNDEWVITNIEQYSNNKIVVVDRWGSVIYSASGYNNTNIVWKGTNMRGDMVPTGTYFYTISVRYGPVVLEKTGFIELIR